MITYHLQELGKDLNFYTSNYEKMFSMGDFNSEIPKLQLIHSAIYAISNF